MPARGAYAGAQSSFSVDVSAFVAKVGERANAVVRKVFLDMSRDIVMGSPVDTGRFRANWQASADAAVTGTLAIVDKGGPETLSRIASSLPDKPAGRVLYLQNNLPYAIPLEYGHSKQNSGFVARATLKYQSYIDDAVRSLP